MENEKLIVIYIEGEQIDSFTKEYSELGMHFYCIHNGLKIKEVLNFTAFVFVEVEWL